MATEPPDRHEPRQEIDSRLWTGDIDAPPPPPFVPSAKAVLRWCGVAFGVGLLLVAGVFLGSGDNASLTSGATLMLIAAIVAALASHEHRQDARRAATGWRLRDPEPRAPRLWPRLLLLYPLACALVAGAVIAAIEGTWFLALICVLGLPVVLALLFDAQDARDAAATAARSADPERPADRRPPG